MAKSIDLFAALRRTGGRYSKKLGRSVGNKAVIEFTPPDLHFHHDEAALAQGAAAAITEIIKSNMLAGKAPDGSPLPAVSAATVKRREYRDKQAANGGKPTAMKNEKKIARGLRSWQRRFRSAQLGEFTPLAHGNDRFGLESGLLAASPRAVPGPAGTWHVFFANNRGLIDVKGSSAMERVFSRITIWSDQANRQPAMQKSLQRLADGLIAVRALKILAEASRAAGTIGAISDQAADAADE